MTKKILAVVLAAALLLTCGILVFAEGTTQTITVEFDANTGVGTVDAIVVEDGKIIVPECTMTKDLYKFDSWNLRADGSSKKFIAGDELIVADLFVEGDPELEILNTEGKITLYAQWISQNAEDFTEYYVLYDANGGEGTTTDDFGYMAGFEAMVAFNEFTYGDYEFYHWNTKPDNSGDVYDEGDTIVFADENASDITLYAIWYDPATGTLISSNNGDNNTGETPSEPTPGDTDTDTDVEVPAETDTDATVPEDTEDTKTTTTATDTDSAAEEEVVYETIETLVPETGDASSIAIALAVSAVAMGALVVLKKKED